MDCIFCAIVAGDAPAEILREDDDTIAFLDIAPLTRGHALVIPREHRVDLTDVGPERAAAVMRAAVSVGEMLRSALDPAGMNLLHASGAVAWQTVFHFHVHVLPRYPDDGFPPFVHSRTVADREELARVAAQVRAAT